MSNWFSYVCFLHVLLEVNNKKNNKALYEIYAKDNSIFTLALTFTFKDRNRKSEIYLIYLIPDKSKPVSRDVDAKYLEANSKSK